MKLSAFLLLSLIGSFSIYAQTETNSDIGLMYGYHDLYRLNFEYRKPLNNKWKLRLGVMAGASHNNPWYNSSNIISASDTLVIERFRTEDKTQFTFFAGTEKKLRQSIFSISADLLFSYLQINDGYYSKERAVNNNNEWLTIPNYSNISPSISNRTKNFLNPGVQLKFAMDLPIKERFILHASIGGIMSSPIYLNETIQDDPLSEFKPHTKTTIFNLTNQANIGIRYIFKGK